MTEFGIAAVCSRSLQVSVSKENIVDGKMIKMVQFLSLALFIPDFARISSANFLTRKSCACKHSERGRPNNNSTVVLVVWSLVLLVPPAFPDLINIPPWAPFVPPVLIRSWNLWRTHIRDDRPICARQKIPQFPDHEPGL